MGGDSKQTTKSTQKQNNKQKTKTKSDPYAPAKPLIDDMLAQAGKVTPVDTSKFASGLANYGQGLLPAAQGGMGVLSDFSNGKYVGSDDPELQSLLGTINTDVMHQINGEFDRAGRSVGGQYANAVARGLSSGLAAPLLQNLQTSRGQQYGAANSLMGYGSQAPSYLNAAAASPYYGLNAYSNLLLPIAGQFSQGLSKGSGNTWGTGTSTMTQSSNPVDQAIGVGLGGAAIAGKAGLFSDRRLKDDIEPVGELYDGTPVYRFRFKGRSETLIGLMADDVEQRTPEAVHTHSSGYKVVDYKMATEGARR